MGQNVDWMGFSGKTVWDWMEIAIIPLSIALAMIYFEISNKNKEHNILKEKFILEQKLSSENRSRNMFDSFLNYYTEIVERNKEITLNHKNIIKYKVRSLVRTATPFWVGETIDFISNSKIFEQVHDILSDNTFEDISISSIKFKGLALSNSSFIKCHFPGSVFVYSKFYNVRFLSCVIKGINLGFSSIKNIYIENTLMTGAQFSRSSLVSGKFLECHMSGAIFDYSTIDHINFDRCIMRNSSMSGVRIIKSKFEDTDLTNSSLESSNIYFSFFERCAFHESNMEKSRIENCIFLDCEFNLSNLKDIEIISARFINCTFTDAKNIPQFLIDNINEKEIQIGDMKDINIEKGAKIRYKTIKKSTKSSKNKIDMSNTLTPEEKALASIRRAGMQYKNDGLQYLIIENIYNILSKNLSLEKSDMADFIIRGIDIPISRNRIYGVIKILLYSGSIEYDKETRKYRLNSESLEDAISLHDDFLIKKFKEFGADFSHYKTDSPCSPSDLCRRDNCI